MRILSHILKILDHLHRPRHYWKYVSPQRRSAGIIVLALLVGCLYGWWALTNDGRTRRHARKYLRRVTGAHVSVDQAKFRLFGPIELRGVRIDIPDERGLKPFVSAKTVLLRHRPWKVFFSGTVEPTEVVCIEPSVWIEHDQEKNTYNFQKLLVARSKKAPAGFDVLPRISARKCRYHPVEIIDSIAWPGDPMTWHITMIPQGRHYKLHIAESRDDDKPPVDIRGRLDVADGTLSEVSVVGEIPELAKALPQRYRVWRQTYSIKGQVNLKAQVPGPQLQRTMQVQFENDSMSLPTEQGGVGLEDVKGGLAFGFSSPQNPDAGYVELVNITGKIPQAGGAQFAMSGKFDGFKPSDPFELQFEIKNAIVPPGEKESRLGQILDFIQRWYKPIGKMDVSGKIIRTAGDSPLRYDIDVFPKDLSICFKRFAYRVNEINGKISVKDGVVDIQDLKGKRDLADITLSAQARLGAGGSSKDYDIDIKVLSADLTDELISAMPGIVQKVIEQVNPRGTGSARVQLHKRPDMPMKYKADIWADGHIGIRYKKFPYPLDNIRGMLHLDEDDLWTDSANPPKAELDNGSIVTLTGKIRNIKSDDVEVDFFIKGSDVVIDDSLIESIPKIGKALKDKLKPSGLVRRLTASIVRKPESGFDYDVKCSVESGSILPEMFRYRLDDVAGDIRIQHDTVTVDKLSGSHKTAKFTSSGTISLNGTDPMELNISANGVMLDKDLYEALNEKGKRIYSLFKPEGAMGFDLSVFRKAENPELDYVIQIRPVLTKLSYEKFPYEFKNLSGLVTARPGNVKLTKFVSNVPPMSLMVGGEIKTLGDKTTAALSVYCDKMPVDSKLLQAVKGSFPEIDGMVLPGGTCGLDIGKLSVDISPGKKADWAAEGKIRLGGVSFDLASGKKKLTGSLSGKLSQKALGGLAAELDAKFDKLAAGKLELSDVNAKITKKADAKLIVFDDLFARVCKGRLAGRRTMISLAKPPKYAVSVFYENVCLAELAKALGKTSEQISDVKGTLLGKISLEAVWDDPESLRGIGEMTISDAKIYDLPIPLGVVHVLTLSNVYDTAFNEGFLKYRVEGQKIIFDEIYLVGPAISLVGSGTLNIKNERIDLKFIQGPPGRIPRIRGLGSEVLGAIAREISQIRISGTLSKPVRKTVPLQSLDRIIKILLQPERTNN